ncbi:MAG: beta-ketoacyl synthase chain length factor [Formosimonas sp.]
MQFSIQHWAAWAPNLDTQEAWQAWAQNPFPLDNDGQPETPEIPAMQRRRMNRLSKMAYWVTQKIPNSATLPQIYCSRHGDFSRTVELLAQLANNEPLSSTHFALSVHNAVGGGISILQNNLAPISSLAAGENRIGAALQEACNHLTEYEQVVVVVYDDLPPEIGACLKPPTQAPYAFALLITRGTDFSCQFSANPTIDHHELSTDLQFLAFLLAKKSLNYTVNGVQWQWSKSY